MAPVPLIQQQANNSNMKRPVAREVIGADGFCRQPFRFSSFSHWEKGCG